MIVRITVIGTGRVGSVLGRRLAAVGHEVVFGSRDSGSERVQELVSACGHGVRAASLAEAADHGEVIIYAAPWPVAEEILKLAGGAPGRILVDCTNPINASFDGLDLGFTESAAERIAAWAPEARVVKGFNTVSSATMGNPNFGGEAATMFLAGDDDEAKSTVAALAGQLGFDAVDAGPLRNARYIEPFAMLYIQLAVNGWGSNFAFKIMKREAN